MQPANNFGKTLAFSGPIIATSSWELEEILLATGEMIVFFNDSRETFGYFNLSVEMTDNNCKVTYIYR